MAVKKSVLYSKLWDSCNTLRSKGRDGCNSV